MNASSDRIRKILVSIAQANTPPANGPSVLYPVSSLDNLQDTANLARHRRHKYAWIAFAENLGAVGSLSASLITLNFSLLTAIIMFGSIVSIVLVGVCAATAGAIVGWHIGHGLAKLKRPDLYLQRLRAASTYQSRAPQRRTVLCGNGASTPAAR